VSGYLFFGTWAEWFFTQEGFYAIGNVILNAFSGQLLAIVYSIFYNGLYMIPELVITAVCASGIAWIPYIKKYDVK
jgi:thiamine transporter